MSNLNQLIIYNYIYNSFNYNSQSIIYKLYLYINYENTKTKEDETKHEYLKKQNSLLIHERTNKKLNLFTEENIHYIYRTEKSSKTSKKVLISKPLLSVCPAPDTKYTWIICIKLTSIKIYCT